MEHFIWAFVAIVFIVVVNYRLGQYLTPPLLDEMKDIRNHFDFLTNEVSELKGKINSLMLDRSMRD